MRSCLTLLPSCLPHHDGLSPQTSSQIKPSHNKLLFVRCFITGVVPCWPRCHCPAGLDCGRSHQYTPRSYCYFVLAADPLYADRKHTLLGEISSQGSLQRAHLASSTEFTGQGPVCYPGPPQRGGNHSLTSGPSHIERACVVRCQKQTSVPETQKKGACLQ